MSDEPIIDLSSDDYFMGEALRQAMKAWDAEEVPIGAVIVNEGRILSRGFNQVEMLNDATAHADDLDYGEIVLVAGHVKSSDEL